MMLATVLVTGMVGLAGALGALARYALGRFIAERAGSQFPLGTIFINVTGALFIGLLFALTGRHLLTPLMQSILATGFLGGYTTFSTMSWETVQLARGGGTRRSLLYLAGNVVPGLCAAIVGLALGWWL